MQMLRAKCVNVSFDVFSENNKSILDCMRNQTFSVIQHCENRNFSAHIYMMETPKFQFYNVLNNKN